MASGYWYGNQIDKGAIVTVEAEHPDGAWNTDVKGRVGIVVRKATERMNGQDEFEVKDSTGTTWWFDATQIRFATDMEIAEALGEMIVGKQGKARRCL